MPIETPPSDEVRLAAHRGDGQAGAGEAQQLLLHVGGDRSCRPRPARRGRRCRRRAGPSGCARPARRPGRRRPGRSVPLKPQTALGVERVHVHRLRAVAPAGRDGERDADALAGELLGGRCAASATPPMQVSAMTHSTGRPFEWRRFARRSAATAAPCPWSGPPATRGRPSAGRRSRGGCRSSASGRSAGCGGPRPSSAVSVVVAMLNSSGPWGPRRRPGRPRGRRSAPRPPVRAGS